MAIFHSLNKYRDFGLLVIRVGLGAMFIFHGYPKMMGGPAGWAEIGASTKVVGINFAPVFWGLMAALSEALGGFLILVGLIFRPACLLLLITLAIAAITHFVKGDGLSGASHAVEAAIMFTGLFIIGPGRYSADRK